MITFQDVGVTFPGGIEALRPASLTFGKGSFTVLLGPSGAGKSTLLRCINHLTVPTSGTVSVSGIGPLAGKGRQMRRHRSQTAMIFQQHQLIARFTALQNTLLGGIGRANWVRTMFPTSRSEKVFALECLERVGLLEKAETRVDNLSGGQQQRVGIARSLFQQPTILLADEPVASLDPETSKGVLTLMHSICAERGLTAVVSLHQVDLAKAFADRIIGLADGGIVYDGIPEEISIDDLAIIYTRGAAPALSATGNDVVSDLEEEAACAAASQW